MEELLDGMTAREAAEWMAYAEVEPFGPPREDQRAGQVAAAVANVHRGKSREPFTPSDFLPTRETIEAPREKTPEELLAAFKKAAE